MIGTDIRGAIATLLGSLRDGHLSLATFDAAIADLENAAVRVDALERRAGRQGRAPGLRDRASGVVSLDAARLRVARRSTSTKGGSA